MYYELDCGCRFKQFGTELKNIDNLPSIEIDYYNIRNCPKVWNLFKGSTKGIFQLESGLGKNWSHKLEPFNIEELAALMTILRPGSLEAIVDGKSITQHYVDRKHGREPSDPIHPSLSIILQESYGLIIYQEQIIRITQHIAGFNEVEADIMRKAVGQKDVKLMAEVKKKFLTGCEKTNIVSKDEAEYIFDLMEKSQRYLFNKSIHEDTLVETLEGFKLIKDIKIGDFVKSHEGFIEVINKYDHGQLELFEITLEDGKTIKCTQDHKFACSDGSIRPLWQILELGLEIIIE